MDVHKDEEDTLRNKEIEEVHSTDLTDENMNDTAHNTQEAKEPEREPLNTYLIINEEEDDDKLVGYLRAMHSIEELEEPDDKHIVRCYSMQLHNEEDDLRNAALELTPVHSVGKGTSSPGPDGAQDADVQKLQPHWTWRLTYGAVH